jgi:predicted TIM-barrel fold metal-dependent hydrolase
MSSSSSSYYPKEVVDPHHHFLDTANNSFQTFLNTYATNVRYLPDDYIRDVIHPLAKMGVTMIGTVHVEAMPDNGVDEVAWVEQMMTRMTNTTNDDAFVKGYVASANLTDDDIEQQLQTLIKTTPKLRGIRWILDCVGKFMPDGKPTATHVGTTRHDGIDYLKTPQFERGLALLEKYNLSFDLQCAPIQLVESAAALFGKYPSLKVCIDHLGKPRTVLGNDLLEEDGESVNPNVTPNEDELVVWRKGMKAMAQLPNVHVKISMLGYTCPGWMRTTGRQEFLKSLVRETVELFTPNRCMVAWNWHVNAAISDADGLSDVGPDAVELLEKFNWFFEGYSDEDKDRLFAGTAKEFYRIG